MDEKVEQRRQLAALELAAGIHCILKAYDLEVPEGKRVVLDEADVDEETCMMVVTWNYVDVPQEPEDG